MKHAGLFYLINLSILMTSTSFAGREALPRKFDIVVYGASAGGVVSAVSAGREGKSVILIEPGRHLGGMVSGGLGATDHGNRAAIGGLSGEFFRRVRSHYVEKYGEGSPQVKDCSNGFLFEPHVAELVFRKLLDELKVEVVFDSTLGEVRKDGGRIVSIATSRGDVFEGSMFIDASYEGDLMDRAGLKSTVGREARDQYHESIAGVQERSPAHQFPVAVPALGYDGMPLPTIQGKLETAGPTGAGDDKTQAYNYRLCMTERKDNQVPFPRPSGYDPKRYELLFRYLARKPNLKVGQLMNPVRVPNGKTDTNNNGPISTDHIGANWDYPTADEASRKRIREDHVAYIQGFLYFLANDPRVPTPLHDEINRWGLAKDEFTDTDHWPHQLYVREARRMLGVYVMTQSDIMEHRTKPDSVGLGSYNTDSHHVQRLIQADGSVLNEGDFQVKTLPYAIPYGSLVPRPEECSNLLVPVCVSASHVAYGTIRMEPVYMILGHACGVAASLAIDGKSTVQAVPTDRLTAKLIDQGAVLNPDRLPIVSTVASGKLDPAGLGGIVVDDEVATRRGEWTNSRSNGPWVGAGYSHDGAKADGRASVRYTPDLPKAGRYEVRAYSTPHPNRATNTPIVVHSSEPERTVRVNQRQPTKDGGPIVVGIFSFAAGREGWVEIRNDGADGFVIADAIQFVPVP